MLRLTIVFSALIALAVARTAKVRSIVPILDGRIVGGETTTIEELPYQLSLQILGTHLCGASIISTTRALTAAHCTEGYSTWYMSVRAGSSFRGTGGQVVRVASVCQHPGYDSKITDYDVSVLRLSSPLVIGSGVRPISLVDLGQAPSTGTLATVSGWGTTSSGGSLATQLQKVEVPRVSDFNCAYAYEPLGYNITDSMICFGYPEGGKDSCQQDSGGPLVTGGTQVGIVSWGIGCGSSRFPGVYADISKPSIRNHIDSC